MKVRPSGGIHYRWGSADRLRVSSNDGGALSVDGISGPAAKMRGNRRASGALGGGE